MFCLHVSDIGNPAHCVLLTLLFFINRIHVLDIQCSFALILTAIEWYVHVCIISGCCNVHKERCMYIYSLQCAHILVQGKVMKGGCVLHSFHIYYVNEEPGSDSCPYHECLVWLCGLVTRVYTYVYYKIFILWNVFSNDVLPLEAYCCCYVYT